MWNERETRIFVYNRAGTFYNNNDVITLTSNGILYNGMLLIQFIKCAVCLTLEQRRATIVAVRERMRIAEGHFSGQAGWHNINA